MKQDRDHRQRIRAAAGAAERHARAPGPVGERLKAQPPQPRPVEAPRRVEAARPPPVRLLSSRSSLRRAIVLSEVLGAPKALRGPEERF